MAHSRRRFIANLAVPGLLIGAGPAVEALSRVSPLARRSSVEGGFNPDAQADDASVFAEDLHKLAASAALASEHHSGSGAKCQREKSRHGGHRNVAKHVLFPHGAREGTAPG